MNNYFDFENENWLEEFADALEAREPNSLKAENVRMFAALRDELAHMLAHSIAKEDVQAEESVNRAFHDMLEMLSGIEKRR